MSGSEPTKSPEAIGMLLGFLPNAEYEKLVEKLSHRTVSLLGPNSLNRPASKVEAKTDKA
jgi:hypothetical protein